MEINRRQFLGYAALALGGCSSVRNIDKTKPRIAIPVDIKDARKYEEKRQLFLDYIVSKIGDMPEVEGVFYDPICERYFDFNKSRSLPCLFEDLFISKEERDYIIQKRNRGYANVVYFPCQIGQRKKHPIFIQTPFFEENTNYIAGEKEAVSLIKDHEYFHAVDYFNGIIVGDIVVDHRNVGLMDISSMEALTEARAYHNQIIKSLRKQIIDGKEVWSSILSSDMLEDGTENFVKHYKTLEEYSGGKDFKAKVCSKQLELLQDLTFQEFDEKIRLIYREKN